ncbi:hypothetical protein GX48_05083 [Paracoccidioides brasiliensis]|nr:hypothetical protein GX48_05083 [Paracoccidioides brasiliensis]
MGVMPSVKYDDTSTSSYFRKNSFDRGTRSTQSHIPKALCQELPNTVPFVKDAPPRRVNCLGAYWCLLSPRFQKLQSCERDTESTQKVDLGASRIQIKFNRIN